MKTQNEASDVIRNACKMALCESGLDETDLADEVFPHLSNATVFRLLNTDQPFKREHVDVILHGVRNLVDRDNRIFSGRAGLGAGMSSWMAVARCARIDSEEQKYIRQVLAETTSRAKTLWHFGRNLPMFLLEEEVTAGASTYEGRYYSRNADLASAFFREIAASSRDDFMNFRGVVGANEINIVTPLSALIRTIKGRTPFIGVDDDHIDASFASIIADGLLEPARNFRLSVLNDMIPGPARDWIWANDRFSSVSLFDAGVAIRRRHRTCVYSILDARQSSAARDLLDTDLADFEQAQKLACHDVSRHGTAAFLQEFVRAARGDKATWQLN